MEGFKNSNHWEEREFSHSPEGKKGRGGVGTAVAGAHLRGRGGFALAGERIGQKKERRQGKKKKKSSKNRGNNGRRPFKREKGVTYPEKGSK